ncbi:DNA-directed RNA polymerase subunit beta [Dethiosulfatarculus sandiegensis]|uniref:DNA-directed RNA polymerase subunit beta n=1 Tax=Dethiosulfatarculus sandiegensis TaxID=1429043 RepID=A0A0D2JJZ5_9BACT|nr:DNA-directed RNA polymerase subunit beta [Dethiosulfatarculus sandiegensis]KIX15946.1 DNA-directed RNA polymerase subunit beta [Dethiosulfatarculus sandiegensis]
MSQVSETKTRVRKNFGKIAKIVDIPNLIDMQRQSYETFLQKDVPSSERKDVGLQGVFKSVFPIRDFSGTSSLEFVGYAFGEVKYDVEECLARGMTYEAPLKLTVRLVVFDVDKETEAQTIRDIKEQEIYFGTLPLMTDRGTFIVNGTERVVVSQLHRSPGIFLDHDKGRTHSSGKLLYSARIIPLRGSWIDFEFDPKDILYVRIDRRRKFPVTLLLKALGYSAAELLRTVYKIDGFELDGDQVFLRIDQDRDMGRVMPKGVPDPEGEKPLVKPGKKMTRRALKRLAETGTELVLVDDEMLEGAYAASDLADPVTGELLVGVNQPIDSELLAKLKACGVKEVPVLHIDGFNNTTSFRDTLELDKVEGNEDAIVDIYRRLRPSNPPTLQVAKAFFNNLFFSAEHYDLSAVGRLKLNLRLGLDVPVEVRTLRKEDILTAVKLLIELKESEGQVDDIDHLGNRRVRAVGELLENQYRIGLVRMERAIKERMSLQEIEALMPHDLINSKPVSAVVKEFFGTSQLSQFMDQTNPLSEVTHKRRLSALGPGGLTRERAGFEVRDVHSTHYGRICPIETPEGPNIGLIVSLSTYARVNDYGFIETPYRSASEGKASKDVQFLSALDEEGHIIAQANAPLDDEGNFVRDIVTVREQGEFAMVPPEDVEYMDVSPNQLVSVAASLIPFLENDDANRALMGSNMQRQAVPLLRTDAPLVGTGIEGVVARDSGVCIVAEADGVVDDVDAARIVVRYDEPLTDEPSSQVKIYKLVKYQRSNQNTCSSQKAICVRGQRVKKGQILADGPAVQHGELALGHNVVVAFMSWGGYNYEDSILISERIVKDDVFTSVHIEEFEIVARDTKLGKEEITRDIPNVGEEALANLDESGIIRVGAEIRAGDVLVGKITPKGETQLSPEEKLLRAIFGEKAGDVKDTSLRVPPGVEGIVIDARVFSRKGIEKDERAQSIEDAEVNRLLKDQEDEIRIMRRNATDILERLLQGVSLAAPFKGDDGRALIPAKTELTGDMVRQIPMRRMLDLDLAGVEPSVQQELERVVSGYMDQVETIRNQFEDKISKLKKGDELPPGVIKMVKVYVAMKRKLSVGDKMAGRHGNKGVVSRILPEEDLPHFPDGTPVDIVLNPLGVPSRMNVGQVLETHLGWASKGLGAQINKMVQSVQAAKEEVEKNKATEEIRQYLKKVHSEEEYDNNYQDVDGEELLRMASNLGYGVPLATPVFDGAQEDEIRSLLKLAGLPESAQARLIDGRTGEYFDKDVTVGVMYMLKLHHLVDDKIHARSIGPYSLVTQQPLGGKAQFGGQRLGEMEVWAMEAYGAAYCLQEFLTVKSDDVAGRTRMYEKIVKGDNFLEAGLPESFNVLVKELQALCLDVELTETTAQDAALSE